jgi:hypothetical protein
MTEALDPGAVAEQLGQQGQELLERSQAMIADMLRGYLGQFQVRVWGHGVAWSCCVHARAAAAEAGLAWDLAHSVAEAHRLCPLRLL